MTLIIDDQSDPGAYADKFKDAPWYQTQLRAWEAYQRQQGHMAPVLGNVCRCHRCYRDRKAHDKLIATTNAIRAKHGMEPL